jgi:DNA-binding NarL/FixJ family response regulator
MAHMKIRIILADDHRIIRDGIRVLLGGLDGMEVIADVGDGRTAVKLAAELKPDVIVMDIGMPDLNGMEATRQIKAQAPGVQVIALSMHRDVRFVSEMLRAGASGYLLKESAFEELARAIQAVTRHETYLSPGISGVIVQDYVSRLGEARPPGSVALTPREREVLQLISEGHSSKEIAFRLHVSLKTVETHRHQIMNKLGLRSVAELTKYALREGLTAL